MRIALAMVLVTITAVRLAVADPAPSGSTWSHIRARTSGAAQLVLDAAAYSPAVRTLLDAVEQTDVVVYVSDSRCGPIDTPPAYLRFVTRAAGLRYVEVYVDRFRLSPVERIAAFAHELQHALEIGAAPDVQDAAGLKRLYRRIGWECGPNQFETDAARAVTRLVTDELAGFGK